MFKITKKSYFWATVRSDEIFLAIVVFFFENKIAFFFQNLKVLVEKKVIYLIIRLLITFFKNDPKNKGMKNMFSKKHKNESVICWNKFELHSPAFIIFFDMIELIQTFFFLWTVHSFFLLYSSAKSWFSAKPIFFFETYNFWKLMIAV